MGYFVHLTDRENLPDGRDWMLIAEPHGGDMRFVVARDAEPFELSCSVVDRLVEAAYVHLAAAGDPGEYGASIVEAVSRSVVA